MAGSTGNGNRNDVQTAANSEPDSPLDGRRVDHAFLSVSLKNTVLQQAEDEVVAAFAMMVMEREVVEDGHSSAAEQHAYATIRREFQKIRQYGVAESIDRAVSTHALLEAETALVKAQNGWAAMQQELVDTKQQLVAAQNALAATIQASAQFNRDGVAAQERFDALRSKNEELQTLRAELTHDLQDLRACYL